METVPCCGAVVTRQVKAALSMSVAERVMVVAPSSATVAENLPLPGAGLAGKLVKITVRYLSLQYSDEDSRVSGIAAFKLDNQEIMDSVLFTLANKAGLTPRGQIYVRKAP